MILVMLDLLAHAGETHESSSESTSHLLESWYVALPLFLLAVAGIATIVYVLSKRSLAATYLAVVAIFLVSGIFLYDKSAVISVMSLTIGLFGSVIVVLTSLAKTPESSKNKARKK